MKTWGDAVQAEEEVAFGFLETQCGFCCGDNRTQPVSATTATDHHHRSNHH
jgi:hypothetical protein